MSSSKTFEKLISTMFTMRRQFIDRLESAAGDPDRISILHLEVLQLVSEVPGLPMRHVAEHFCITPPSATSLIEGMVGDGYLKRTVDSRDRRLVRLAVTSAGRRRLKQGKKSMESKMYDLLRVLSDEEAERLIKIIQKLTFALDKHNAMAEAHK